MSEQPTFTDGPAPTQPAVQHVPETEPAYVPPPAPKANYFDVYTSLTAGDKLQILRALGVEERSLVVTGTAQLVAVVWKFRRSLGEDCRVSHLLEMTDDQLLALLGLSDDEYAAQIEAWLGGGQSKS